MSAKRRAELTASLARFGVPEHLREGLIAYVIEGRQTGSFLRSCLENNFVDAMCHSIDLGAVEMIAVAKWLYNEAPGRCWGNPNAVKAWRGE